MASLKNRESFQESPLAVGKMTIMNELEKARRIEASPAIRERALDLLARQTKIWGVALPKAAPLVLDFGLGHFETIGLTEIWIANEEDAGYCGKYMFVHEGQTCPMHHHLSKHETFFVVQGRVRVLHEGREITLTGGDVLSIPTRTKHSFTGMEPALLLELSQPCRIEDNYFEDTRIPIGGNCRHSQTQ